MPQYFTIASALNGYVLDIQGADMMPGTKVVTYSVNGQDNQYWYEDTYQHVIRSKMNRDMVLDIDNDGSLIIMPYDPDSVTQKLVIAEDRIHTLADLGMVLDVADNDSGLSARVCLYEFNGGNNQSWELNLADTDMFVIRSQLNGLVLDINDNNPSAGTEVCMYDFNGQDNQLWYEDRYGVIRSKLNDFVLDCSYGDLVMNPFDPNNPSQGFGIMGEAILNLRDPTQCMDIKDNDTSSGARLCSWGYNGGDNQHWVIEYI